MNKKGHKENYILIFLSLLSILFFCFAIVFIFINYEFLIFFIILNIALLIVLVIFLIIVYQKKTKLSLSVEDFEKTLQGGLFHFKCSLCNGIFAIKKSKGNNNKVVKMNCPDCGAIGLIPKNPICISEEIPEKKSIKANFRCFNCGEGITVWAEGTELFKDLKVYSCPFCGVNKTLRKF